MTKNDKHAGNPSSTETGVEVVENTITNLGVTAAELRSRFKGRAIVSADHDYDQARQIFYGGIDRRPAVVIRVADADDVIQAIALAHETKAKLAVRSGGHSVLGFGLADGGIVIDLKDMHRLQIDPEKRTAWAETGLTTGEYTLAADTHGLATGFGDTATVGIGGLTLGGGVGYLSRKHGLTIDSLLGAEIVTADGRVHSIDEEHEPDLFWAIRGGGGNFGVVTRFKYRLHELGDVLGGMLCLPATPEVIAGFIHEAEAAPEELSTIANIMPAPPMPFLPPELHGKMIVLAMLLYAGKVEKGMKVIEPFKKLAQPLVDMIHPMRYPEMFPPEDPSYHPTAIGYTMFMDRFDGDIAKTFSEQLESSSAVFRVAQIRVLGGAVKKVKDDATAYAHRQRPIMANLAAFYTTPDDHIVQQAWLDGFAAAVSQGELGGYVNFLTAEGDGPAHRAYPEKTWNRLAAIKARYDPQNLFRLNQNVPPE